MPPSTRPGVDGPLSTVDMKLRVTELEIRNDGSCGKAVAVEGFGCFFLMNR